MEFQETYSFLYECVAKGVDRMEDLSVSQRKALVSIYISELALTDSLFEGNEPSRLIVSRFLTSTKSFEAQEQLGREITDCIYFAHSLQLENIFDSVVNDYMKDCGIKSDIEDWRNFDNHERYLDMSAEISASCRREDV